MKNLICAVLFLVGLAGPAAGQDSRAARFEQLSVEDGLSQSAVLSMIQDRRGFLWVGTMDGLNLFDGYGFTVFKMDPKDQASLVHNSVRALFEDSAGRLWVGTPEGLDIFDREHLTFRHFKADPSGPSGPLHRDILCIYEDRAGVLWVGSSGGLDKVGWPDGPEGPPSFAHYLPDSADPKALSSGSVTSLFEDSRGRFWVGTSGGGLNLFDRARGVAEQVALGPSVRGEPDSRHISFIFEDRGGHVWFGTNYGLYRIAREGENGSPARFERFLNDPSDPASLSHDAVFAGCEDAAGGLWFGTYGGGLCRLASPPAPGERPAFVGYRHDPELAASLGNDFILSLRTDRSGILWVGTSGGGLFKLTLSRERFAHFQAAPENPRRLGHNFLFSVYQDRRGVTWLGSREGLLRLDRRRDPYFRPLAESSFPGVLRRAVVRAIIEDDRGRLWFASHGSGAFRYDPATRRLVRYHRLSRRAGALPHNGIMALHMDKRGRVWLGTAGGGLLRYNEATDDFTVFKNEPQNPNSLAGDDVRVIYEDSEGALWVGVFGAGLNRIVWRDAAGTEPFVSHYRYDPDNSNTLSSNEVLSLCEGRDGSLWIGTRGGGLNRFDWEKGVFTCYLERHGLANNTVYGILEDGAGHLWLSTNNGLSEFDPQTRRFRTHNVRDGLQSNEFNAGAFFRSADGEMFFGGINGLNAFRPDEIRANEYRPPVAVTRVETSRRGGGELVSRPLLVTPDEGLVIRLAYRDAAVGFEFVALDFTSPAKNLYACLMEGLDTEWVQMGNRHRVTYADLAPGSYTFRVRGSNSDGVWNEEDAAVRLIVGRPVWQAPWFLFLAALAAVAGAYGILRARRRARPLPVGNEASLEKTFAKFNISKRERQIIRLVLQGKSNVEIEKELFISVHTVKNHIYNIYQKLGVKNRFQIIRLFRDYDGDR